MLVTLSLGQTQTCKSFLYGGDSYYPLDFCANVKSAGTELSYDYSCDGTTVMYNVYTKGGCSGTKTSAAATGATMVKCDGGVCDNVAVIKLYSTSTCAATDTYSSLPYLTDICVIDEFQTDVSYKYSCAGGNVTYSYYAGTTCSGTATMMATAYYNMECYASSIYYEVECDAKPAGSQANLISFSYMLYCLLFLTIVKLL